MIHASGIWLCATLVLAAPPRERTEATRLFRLGNQQMDQGRYLQAIRHFERAYELFASPKILFNMAQAFKLLGRTLEALRYYERFVVGFDRRKSPKLWGLANKRLGKQG